VGYHNRALAPLIEYVRSRYQVFRLDSSAVFQCLDLTGRALILFSWMASNARNELSRATHFIAWLRYGTADPPPMPSSIEKSHDDAEVARTHTGDPPPAPPPLRHDVLRVNEYLVSGLEQSPLDRFFTGPIPRFTLQDIGVPRADMDLAATMARARLATQAPSRLLEPVRSTSLLFNDQLTCMS
jgi:anaphase-promoting complex subunit 4